MNFLKKIALFSLITASVIACKDASKEKDGTIETPVNETPADSTSHNPMAENLETASFSIEGMSCAIGCAAVIEKKLSGMDGVGHAKVDFEQKTATVKFDPAKQSPENFVETVEKIANGAYKVSDVKYSGHKAYYDIDQEKEKEAKNKDKETPSADKAKKKDKKCCSSSKKSCSSENKGGKA